MLMIITLQRNVVLHMGWMEWYLGGVQAVYRAPYGAKNEDGATNDEKTVEAALNWSPSHFLN